jgi:nucleoid-associated protein YgaU
MNSTGRISLLFGAVVLLVFGVVCLKQQISPSASSQALHPGDPTMSSKHEPPLALQPPALLSASPDDPLSAKPIPLEDELHRAPPLTNAHPEEKNRRDIVPAGYQELFSPRASAFDDSPPANEPSLSPNADVVLHPPAGAATLPAELPGEVNGPTAIVTLADDSLWKISERIYGRGDYSKALYMHNRPLLPRPDRIPSGVQLSAPAADELRRLYPDACPRALPNAVRPAETGVQ